MKPVLHASGVALLLAAAAAAQNQVPLPAHSAIYNGFTRGYTFTASNTFLINQVELPLNAFQTGDSASFYLRVNGANTFFNVGGTSAVQATSILINPGDVVDVFGNWSPAAPGTFTAHNSYSASASGHPTTIEGAATTLYRNGVQNDIGNPAYVQGSQVLGLTTTGQIGRVWIYTNPPVGLYPNFTAAPTSGPVGMTVNFTDTTFTSDPGGVLTWDWDLDGDGLSDSNVQNPSFTYNTCGAYDVTLTVTDAVNPATSITKTGYIQVGLTAIAPSFTWASIGGGSYQFTDTSTPAPSTWAWDFDNDGIVDSNLQNPVWAAPACLASTTCRLTVTNSCNVAYTTTQNLTLLPLPTPSFTYAPLGSGVWQFTDTTSPTPSAWSWDLDGDGLPDSTLQNPVWAYTAPCAAVPVTLTAFDACANSGSTTHSIVFSPNSLTTILTGGNGLSGVGSGNTFDINVHNPNGVVICALEMCPYGGTTGAPIGCTIWVTDAAGGYLSNHTNAAVWRQVATGTGTHGGGTFSAPIPVPMTLSNPIFLPPGTYGMAVHMTTGSGVAYTTLAAQTTYPGTDFDIIAGNGKGAPFSSTANNPRGFNGVFHYSVIGSGDLAGYGFLGAGCPGSLGQSTLTNDVPPALGNTIHVTVNNLPIDVAIMLTGLSRTNWLLGALPFDLAAYGAPGCFLRTSTDANLLLLGTGGSAVWPFTIPNNAGLIGLQMYNQAAVLSPGSNAAGAVASDAGAMLIGL